MDQLNHFNIRVYAIILNQRNEILLCDEYHNNMKMTKFPGGGMHFGEGTVDCLKREAMEEFGQEIDIIEHFYTTDFFQKALFYNDHQLISIYYKAKFRNQPQFRISEIPFDFLLKNGNFSFRWKSIYELTVQEITFPIDKYVINLLKEH